MQDNRIARRYALALFEVAKARDVTKSVETDLAAFASLVSKDPSFRSFLFAPYASRATKLELLDKVFSDRMTALTLHEIKLMLIKGREREIAAVYTEFSRLRRDDDGVVFATITSATTLDPEQKQKLVSTLEAKFGKLFEAEFEVDARLIGGIKVAYGAYVIDGSIRGSLDKLRDKLTTTL